MNDLQIYTDGAYTSIKDQGGVGIVMLQDNCKILEYSNMYKRTSNNQMELGAIIIALRLVKESYDSITIYTDSQYVIGCATLGWKRRKNSRLWEEYDNQYERVSELCSNIEFIHVKGHSDDYWNNYVDNLARNASLRIL